MPYFRIVTVSKRYGETKNSAFFYFIQKRILICLKRETKKRFLSDSDGYLSLWLETFFMA